MFLNNIAECKNKLRFVSFALQQIYATRRWVLLQETCCKFLIILLYFIKRRANNIFKIVAVAEKLDRSIHFAFQITETDNLTEAFLFIQYTVGSTECLQQAVVVHVLIYVERIEFFAVKTCQEHTNYQTKVERLHVCFLFLHAKIDVIIICTEVFCSETCTKHIIIIIHNSLQLVCFSGAVTYIATRVHACKGVVLATIGCICKHGTNSYFRIKALKQLIISYKHWYRLHSKQCVKLSVEGRLVEIIKDKLGNFGHAVLVGIVYICITMVIFHKETKHVFIDNGILYEILVKTVAKDFLCSMPFHRILYEDRRTSKPEHLCVVEELNNILVAISEMTAMTLIKNHHNARMADFFDSATIPLLSNCCIELLDSGDDNFGITVKTFHKFVCIIGAVNCTWLKGFILSLCLCVKVVAINHKHYLINVVQFSNKLSCLK